MSFIVRQDIKFLPPSKSSKSGTREKELEYAEIKAHAARISHQRRRWATVQQQLKHQEEEDQRANEAGQRSDGGRQPNSLSRHQFREIILLVDAFHGSSDPFNAWPVKITPEVNRIISFSRDVMLPNVFCPPFFRRLTIGGPTWLDYERSNNVIGGSSFLYSFKAFRNMSEGAALGWLCGHIPQIMRFNSSMTSEQLSVARLKMRARSIRLLREQLVDHPESSAEWLTAVRLHIRTLFEAECMAGDATAAKAHIDILLQLDDPVSDDATRFHNLLILMFNATELACKTLDRTVFPFDRWTAKQLEPLWNLATPFLPFQPPENDGIHPCIADPFIRDAMGRLRFCLSLAETPLPFTTTQERQIGDMIYAWMATRTFQDMGVLINTYKDITESKIKYESEGCRLTMACISLTVLHMYRKCIHQGALDGGIDGNDVRDASAVFIPRLAQDTVLAMEMLTPTELLEYQEAFLWIYYAGALYEERQRMRAARRKIPVDKSKKSAANANSNNTWFITALTKHATGMNITTWDQAVVVLQKFVYDRYWEPDGHLWFDKAIAEMQSSKTPGSAASAAAATTGQYQFQILDFSGKNPPGGSDGSQKITSASSGTAKRTTTTKSAAAASKSHAVPKVRRKTAMPKVGKDVKGQKQSQAPTESKLRPVEDSG